MAGWARTLNDRHGDANMAMRGQTWRCRHGCVRPSVAMNAAMYGPAVSGDAPRAAQDNEKIGTREAIENLSPSPWMGTRPAPRACLGRLQRLLYFVISLYYFCLILIAGNDAYEDTLPETSNA